MYRFFSVLMVVAIFVCSAGYLVGYGVFAIYSLALALGCLLFLVLKIRCAHCGVRPAFRLFWIWLMFLELPLFISDILLLKRCPKCRKDPFRVN